MTKNNTRIRNRIFLFFLCYIVSLKLGFIFPFLLGMGRFALACCVETVSHSFYFMIALLARHAQKLCYQYSTGIKKVITALGISPWGPRFTEPIITRIAKAL